MRTLYLFLLIWFSATFSYAQTPAPCPMPLASVLGQLTSEQANLALLLRNNPELAAEATELFTLLPKLSTGEISVRDPHLLSLVMKIGATAENTGKLPTILKQTADQLRVMGKIPPELSPEKLDHVLMMAHGAISAELSARGLTLGSQGVKYESWASLGSRLGADVQRVAEATLKQKPKISGFKKPDFIKAFEAQTRAKFSAGNEVRLLVDGTESFAERARLIDEARESINVMSWAFYDDVTGNQYADLLIKKAKEKVDVRVMVDGQVAMKPGHDLVLKRMEENGVKVTRWRSNDPLRPFDGQHRKFMLFDNKELVGGGMNIGDHYSHMGPETVSKWRDTDLYIKGPATADAQKVFVDLWNGQNKTAKTRMKIKKVKYDTKSSAKVSVINHQPGVGENIYRANLLAIEAATKSIDIENAYFILDPATYRALLRAKKRGVKVRVLTNSSTSIDEPIVNSPIMKSVNRLVKQGFEVYVKKGTDTLHSKVMVVDGNYSWVGSHNFHPRSFRYEGEVTFNVLDSKFGKSVERMFQGDIDRATRVTAPMEMPKNMQADIVNFYFYDQL